MRPATPAAPDGPKANGTVLRVIRLLRCLAERPGELSIKTLAEALALPPSTVHRLLQFLATEGIVERSEATRGYRVGLEFTRISALIAARADMRDIARPFMRTAAESANETAMLMQYLPATSQMMAVDACHSPIPLRYNIPLFEPRPLFWGAAGRSILAFLPEDEQRLAFRRNAVPSIAGLPPPAEEELFALFARIRAQGYAISFGETIEGAVGIGAPVLARDGRVVGSLGFTLPQIRFQPIAERPLAALIRKQAARVSECLGFTGHYPGTRAGWPADA